jgi:hypothetical protein
VADAPWRGRLNGRSAWRSASTQGYSKQLAFQLAGAETSHVFPLAGLISEKGYRASLFSAGEHDRRDRGRVGARPQYCCPRSISIRTRPRGGALVRQRGPSETARATAAMKPAARARGGARDIWNRLAGFFGNPDRQWALLIAVAKRHRTEPWISGVDPHGAVSTFSKVNPDV